MIELLRGLWEYEVQVVPLLVALMLVLIPNAIRRRQQFFYVPIYFSVFPFRELNSNLAMYLGENYMYGGETDEAAARRLRQRIMVTSMFSLLLTALVVPAFAGFGSAFLLRSEQIVPFVVLFVTVQLWGIAPAIWNFRTHAIGSAKNTSLLVLVYFAYLGVASHVIIRAHGFSRPFVLEGEWLGLLGALSDLVFGRVIVELLLLGGLAALFILMIMDREIRASNLEGR